MDKKEKLIPDQGSSSVKPQPDRQPGSEKDIFEKYPDPPVFGDGADQQLSDGSAGAFEGTEDVSE